MEILGVGPFELVFVLILALIVLGPKEMVKAGRTVGKFLRKIVMSPTWKAVQQTSRDLKNLPNRLMREAGLEEELKDIKQVQQQLSKQMEEIQKLRSPIAALTADLDKETREIQHELGAWTTPPAGQPLPLSNQIAPAENTPAPAELAAPAESLPAEPPTPAEGNAEVESINNPPVPAAAENNPINEESRQNE